MFVFVFVFTENDILVTSKFLFTQTRDKHKFLDFFDTNRAGLRNLRAPGSLIIWRPSQRHSTNFSAYTRAGEYFLERVPELQKIFGKILSRVEI